MSKPWEDPIANAIIELAEGVKLLSEAWDEVALQMRREQDRKDRDRREAQKEFGLSQYPHPDPITNFGEKADGMDSAGAQAGPPHSPGLGEGTA